MCASMCASACLRACVLACVCAHVCELVCMCACVRMRELVQMQHPQRGSPTPRAQSRTPPSIDALNVKVSGLKREFDATSDPEKKSSVARELGQFEEKLEQREKKWKKHGV